VAYATDLKAALLGVHAGLLAERGPVDAEVAAAMAAGARARLGATYGLATTGVAGPDPQAGHPPGEVHLAVAGPGGTRHERLQLAGDRAAVRTATVRRALLLAAEAVSGEAWEAREADG
jgi:nicotinamide-nucleotide amidase